MRRIIVAACLAAACSIATAKGSAEPRLRTEIDTARCSGILDMFAAADPANNPDPKSLAAVQDRAYVFVVWVNGFLSGRDGVDFVRRPLDQKGVTRLVADIHRACSVDESRLFMDAAREIR